MAAGPLLEGTAEEITKDLDANLVECGALMLVYGKASAPWVRAQLRRYSKLERMRDNPPRFKGILFAPPGQKPEIAWAGGFAKIDCPNGLTGARHRAHHGGAAAVTQDDGQRAPYPGLRAFRREETDLFFGREGCVDSMVDRLAATRFLAVLGSSGTGKSSLVKTGLLDALEIGLLHQAGSRWLIADFRPGDAPIKNLARRLLEPRTRTARAQPPTRRRSSSCAPSSRAARARSSNGAAPASAARAPTCCSWSTSSRSCSATAPMPGARRRRRSSRCSSKARTQGFPRST